MKHMALPEKKAFKMMKAVRRTGGGMILGKCLHFPEPQFSNHQNGHNIYLKGLSGELKDTVEVKQLALCYF